MESVRDIEEFIKELRDKIRNNPESLAVHVWEKTLEKLVNLLHLKKGSSDV